MISGAGVGHECRRQRRRRAQAPSVDLSSYRAECGVDVRRDGDRLIIEWPMEDERGQLILDLATARPLIASIGVAGKSGDFRPLLEAADPAFFLLVGSRQAPEGRPPEMSVFNVFFDSPASRPFETHRVSLNLKRVRVASKGRSATIAIDEVSAGQFRGELRITLYQGARLLHVEAVIRTDQDRRAILYDAGLMIRDRRKNSIRLGRHRGKTRQHTTGCSDEGSAPGQCGIAR